MNYNEIVKSMPVNELEARIKSTGNKEFKQALEAELAGRAVQPIKQVKLEKATDVVEPTPVGEEGLEENVAPSSSDEATVKPAPARKSRGRKQSN